MVDFCPDDTLELRAWRREVRAFLEEALPGGFDFDFDYDEDRESWAFYRNFWRQVGSRGWIGLTWPTKYHGLNKPPIYRWILQEEFSAYGAPAHGVIGAAVSSHLLRLGTHEQRLKHLKGIGDGSIFWGEGYTEPQAGTDLAALTTRADRESGGWVLNGQKTLGTAAHHCEWMCVLARTDPDSQGHHGISAFLVPLDAPGIELLPMENIAGGTQIQTFFDNVRLPLDALLGDENQGWKQVWLRQGGAELDRSVPVPEIRQFRMLTMIRQLLRYARETRRDGVPISEDPVIRLQLGELIMAVEVVKMHAFEEYADVMADANVRRPALTSFQQAYYKELWPRVGQLCMDIVGPMAQIQGGRWAQLNGKFEHYFRSSFANHSGGTPQIKRMVAATRGLGLPR